jgi:transposase
VVFGSGWLTMLGKIDFVPPTDLDREIFDATIPADHYLRRVKTLVDFGRFRPLLASCYCIAMGRPAIEPLLLLKLEFLQFQYDLSDRAVIEQARVNLAYRFVPTSASAATCPTTRC